MVWIWNVVLFAGFLLTGNLLLDQRRGRFVTPVNWRGKCRHFRLKQPTYLHSLPCFRYVLSFLVVALSSYFWWWIRWISMNLVTCSCQCLMESPQHTSIDLALLYVDFELCGHKLTIVYGSHTLSRALSLNAKCLLNFLLYLQNCPWFGKI